jgi:hypothetical protein
LQKLVFPLIWQHIKSCRFNETTCCNNLEPKMRSYATLFQIF